MNDVMRVEIREVSALQLEAVKSIKTAGNELHALLEEVQGMGDPRMMAIAKTTLEQAIMWASKALT